MRTGSGIYMLPFPDVAPDTTIESAPHNGTLRDIEYDLNFPRPVVAGGTGATSPAGALDNLGALPLTGGSLTGALEITEGDLTLNNGSITATDDNAILTLAKKLSGQVSAVVGRLLEATRWRLSLGDATPETGGNTGSDFKIERYNDAGTLIDTPFTINRRLGIVTITGPGEGAAPAQPLLSINKTLNGTAAVLQGQYNGVARWGFSLGDGIVETGGNIGSDFRINRYNDAGTLINVPFGIRRSDGVTFVAGAPADQKPIFIVSKLAGTGTQSAMIHGQTAGVTRWGLALGDGSAEVGGNNGSHFKINRHDDSGNFIEFCAIFRRDNATFAVTGDAVKPTGGPWTASSDARIKTVTGEYAQGLDAIKQLRPVTYRFRGNDVQFPDAVENKQKTVKGKPNPSSMHYALAKEGKEFIGLIAQQAEQSMPETVSKIAAEIEGIPVDDYRVLDSGPILYALVNACKELAARVEALEAAR